MESSARGREDEAIERFAQGVSKKKTNGAAGPMLIVPIDGALLLNDVCAFIRRFVAFPDQHCLTAAAVWVAHAHLIDAFFTTPRLSLLSPEPESGKTRVLEVLDTLVPNSMFTLSPSPATIFRTLVKSTITLMIDEVDTIFKRKGKDDKNEDLRGLLNAGYKRGAKIPRCVGPRHDVAMFPVYCAVALAGLGDLPDTIMSRSIIVRMRRRGNGEKVEPFYIRDHEPEGNVLRARLAAWADVVRAQVAAARPVLPDGVVDRTAEVWEPILTVADAAGGDWPQLARQACVAMSRAPDRRVSLGVRLLGDLKIVFGEAIAMHTKTIITKLCDSQMSGLDSDAPWSELNGGKPITDRALATILKRYGIFALKVNVDGVSLQGYRREHLWDAWNRYLPSAPASPEPTEPTERSGRGDTGAGSEEVPLNAGPEPFRNLGCDADALEVPDVPQVPHSLTPTSSTCRRCDGEGCVWCGTDQ